MKERRVKPFVFRLRAETSPGIAAISGDASIRARISLRVSFFITRFPSPPRRGAMFID
jgi:hypothetical protein